MNSDYTHPILHPVTSSNTARYTNVSSGGVQCFSQTIQRGPPVRTAGSTSSSADWQQYIHPEGQLYYVLFGKFDFAVVTEANMRDPHSQGRILDCLRVANKELQLHDVNVPSRCELFLELGDDQVTCNYYFVDHVGKCLFWLNDLATECLDIPPAMSPSHLDASLERLYWVHIEYFPMHHGSHEQDFSCIVGDLYNIISHGQADRLTSRTSTFPYTADTCGHFLKLLSRKKGQRVDGYTLCYAARLAGAIANQRFITLYGQYPAQLDRCQEMFNPNVTQHKLLSTLANLLMWGIPQNYQALLDELHVNEQVYADQWTHFVSKSMAEWKSVLSCSLPILIASILLANVRGGAVSTSIPPVLSCAISIASASVLHLRHQPLVDSSAAVGARYLHFAKSERAGFIPLAAAFSLPRATYLWAVGLLTAQFLLIVAQNVNRVVALIAACGVIFVLLGLFCITSPEDANISSSFRSFVALLAPNMYNSNAPENIV